MPIQFPPSSTSKVVPSSTPTSTEGASRPAAAPPAAQPASSAAPQTNFEQSSFADAPAQPCFIDTPPGVQPEPFARHSAAEWTVRPLPILPGGNLPPLSKRFALAVSDGMLDRNDLPKLLSGADKNELKALSTKYSSKLTPEARLELNKVWTSKEQGDLTRVLFERDLPPIANRFEIAAADRQISRGEIDDLIRGLTAARLSTKDAEQVQELANRYSPILSPEAKTRLDVFLKREVPLLRPSQQQSPTVVVEWSAPVGWPGTMSGYKMYIGTQPGIYDKTVDIADPKALGFSFDKVGAGKHYFALTAYGADGRESGYSNEVSIVLDR
ncbi:MAG: hypothetical protein HY901_34275 [Deltaproteobacteria bacterium]|nr:hypothetical protein [Deltaproteobacteria bacterium]